MTYLEASEILGRNALVETDPPEVIAAARAVCDAEMAVCATEDLLEQESNKAR